jgi:hypothetical protein
MNGVGPVLTYSLKSNVCLIYVRVLQSLCSIYLLQSTHFIQTLICTMKIRIPFLPLVYHMNHSLIYLFIELVFQISCWGLCNMRVSKYYLYRVFKKSLCTWWLQYNRQVHKDFWSPCITEDKLCNTRGKSQYHFRSAYRQEMPDVQVLSISSGSNIEQKIVVFTVKHFIDMFHYLSWLSKEVQRVNE